MSAALKELKNMTNSIVEDEEVFLDNQVKEWIYAFNAIPDPIFIIGLDHTIRFANKKLLEQFGFDLDSILGENCYFVFRRLASEKDCLCEGKYDKPNRLGICSIESIEGWFEHFITPIYDDNDLRIGYIGLFKDVTKLVGAAGNEYCEAGCIFN